MAKVVYGFGCLPEGAGNCLLTEGPADEACHCLHCDPAHYSRTSECIGWLNALDPERRELAGNFLAEQIELCELQRKRDDLALSFARISNGDAMTPTIGLLDRSFSEDPRDQLENEIALLEAAKESAEAANPIEERRRKSDEARREGVKEFQKSGLAINAFAHVASGKHFYDPTSMRKLSHRQIVRILTEPHRNVT